ncbi:MAG TPA: type II secretion system protein GspM [Afifellaceae bacterium]|nr:type II secretion system protein GspM [Afifellaceae bacterium]
MRWLPSHSPASRAAAVALLGIVAALLHALIIAPVWQAYAERNERLAEAAATLQQFAAIAAFGDRVEELASRQNGNHDSALFLPDGQPAVVTADLQARLKILAAQHQVVISSARAVQPRLENGLVIQGLALEVSGETPGMAGFVRDIESAVPFLFVESASLRTAGLVAPVNPTKHVSLSGQLVVVGGAPATRESGT